VSAPAPLDPARERERDRLLTLANVQRMRGQIPEATETLKKALALGEGQSKADAPVHELLGDILAADERWDEAKTAFGTAHALDPARASAERKFAQMTLRIADSQREREMAEAILRGEIPAGTASGVAAVHGKRSPALALLLSGVVPGFGQLYNGQLIKGLVCLGAFLLTVLAINFLPEGKLFLDQFTHFLAARPYRGGGEMSPLLLFLVLVSGILWLYAVIDAPIVASKLSSAAPADDGEPKVDKSGWEV
jgi:tetratricopeptide (TPR) repeat protein